MSTSTLCPRCNTHPITPGYAHCSRECAIAAGGTSARRNTVSSGFFSKLFGADSKATTTGPPPLCAVEGCEKTVYVSPGGTRSKYCSLPHRAIGESLCQLPGCNKPVSKDPKTGEKYQHCSLAHSNRAAESRTPTAIPWDSVTIAPSRNSLSTYERRLASLGRGALIVCDMQEKYQHTVHHFSSVLATTLRMIRFAELFGIQVFTTSGHLDVYGSTISEITEQLNPISKKGLFGGAFTKTESFGHCQELTDALKSGGFSHVMICGVEAHIAIKSQAMALASNGMTVHVIIDGISSCNKEEIPLSLVRLRQLSRKWNVFISTSESIAFEIMDTLGEVVEGEERKQLRDGVLALVTEQQQTTATGLRNLLSNGYGWSFTEDSEAIE
ncbi:hypothetical protein FRC15_001377 [Serendipita sp. 397]|nr:hypothetical protein FRC15_001377 [Serendipita sp. 397]